MCCLALISTGAITASWSQIQQFTWQGSALLDSARIPLPDTEEGGKDIDPDFPLDILDEEAATDFGNGSAEEQAAVRSSSRSSSEEVPDGPDGDPRSQSEEDQEHAGVFNLDEVEDESHGTTLAKKVQHDDGKAPTTLLGIYQELCHMGLRSPGAIRLAAPELRDAVVRLYQPLVERQPPAAFHPERMVTPKSPNCKDPAWKHILDGTRRAVPRALVDVTTGMGGGLLNRQGCSAAGLGELSQINASLGDQPKPAIKDVYVISESAYGLRGDQKPLHFSRQRERFKPFLPQVEHILLDNCTKYSSAISKMRRETNKGKKKGGTMFSAESIQRICVLKTLIQRRPEIPDDALLIFSDLDEVPSAQAIQMLRLCKTKSSAKDGPWIQAHYPLPYNLRVGCKARKKTELHYQGVFTTMGFLRRKKGLALRYNMKRNLIVPRAGIHLTYVGSRADVDYKLLHHGESGQVLATKATATGKRLNFCEIDEKTLASMEQLLRDNPVSVARAWERGKSSVLRKEPAGELSKCQVPWALLTHPERYPHFWGRAAK